MSTASASASAAATAPIWPLIIFLSVMSGLFIYWVRPWVVVSDGYVVLIKRFGRHHRICETGTHPRIPIIDQIHRVRWHRCKEVGIEHGEPVYDNEVLDDYHIPVIEMTYDTIPMEFYTKDNLAVTVNLTIHYKIINAQKAAYTTRNRDLWSHMNQDVEEKLGCLIGRENFEHISQAYIEGEMKRTVHWSDIGVELKRVRVSQIIFPQDIDKSIIAAAEQRRKLDLDKLMNQSEFERARQHIENEETLAKKRRQIELDSQAHEIAMNEHKRLERKKDAELSLSILLAKKNAGLTEAYLIAEVSTLKSQ